MKECEICKELVIDDEIVFYDCNGCPVSKSFDDTAYQVCGVCDDKLNFQGIQEKLGKR